MFYTVKIHLHEKEQFDIRLIQYTYIIYPEDVYLEILYK